MTTCKCNLSTVKLVLQLVHDLQRHVQYPQIWIKPFWRGVEPPFPAKFSRVEVCSPLPRDRFITSVPFLCPVGTAKGQKKVTLLGTGIHTEDISDRNFSPSLCCECQEQNNPAWSAYHYKRNTTHVSMALLPPCLYLDAGWVVWHLPTHGEHHHVVGRLLYHELQENNPGSFPVLVCLLCLCWDMHIFIKIQHTQWS